LLPSSCISLHTPSRVVRQAGIFCRIVDTGLRPRCSSGCWWMGVSTNRRPEDVAFGGEDETKRQLATPEPFPLWDICGCRNIAKTRLGGRMRAARSGARSTHHEERRERRDSQTLAHAQPPHLARRRRGGWFGLVGRHWLLNSFNIDFPPAGPTTPTTTGVVRYDHP
jgi:hypothetical protein